MSELPIIQVEKTAKNKQEKTADNGEFRTKLRELNNKVQNIANLFVAGSAERSLFLNFNIENFNQETILEKLNNALMQIEEIQSQYVPKTNEDSFLDSIRGNSNRYNENKNLALQIAACLAINFNEEEIPGFYNILRKLYERMHAAKTEYGDI